MSHPKPSFWFFLINKSPSTIGFLVFPVFVLSLGVDAWILSRSLSQLQLSCLYVLIASLIFGLGFRIHFEWKKFQELSLIFQNGTEIIGEVTEVNFSKNPGYIRYKYEYQQEIYGSVDSLYQNRKTKSINVGQKVNLYVNPENPGQALIRNLFLNTF